jgi:hypothetical protein
MTIKLMEEIKILIGSAAVGVARGMVGFPLE